MPVKEYKCTEYAIDIFCYTVIVLIVLIIFAAFVVQRKPVAPQTQKETECYKEKVWVCKEDTHLRGKSICRQRAMCREDD